MSFVPTVDGEHMPTLVAIEASPRSSIPPRSKGKT